MLSKFKNLGVRMNAALAFGISERITMYEMLASMLNDGLSLDGALTRINERRKKRKHPLTPIVDRWLKRMHEGSRFSEAIAQDVPAQELVLIAAGERGSDIANGLRQAVKVTQAKSRMRSALVDNLIQPAIYTLILGVLLIGFSTSAVPKLAQVLKPEDWKGSAHLLYIFSSMVRDWWMFGGVVVAGVIAGVGWSLPKWTGSMRQRFDKIPPWSIYRSYASSTFMIALSALMKSGVSLNDALRQVAMNSSPWVRSHIMLMQARIRNGADYGHAMDTGMLDDDTVDQVMIYSTGSEFDKAILLVGERTIELGVKRISSQAVSIKNIVIVLLGVSVAWIYSTVYELNTQAAQVAKQSTMSKR